MEDLALANLLLEVNILSILSVYKHVNHNHLNLGIYNILSLLQSESANQLTNERGSSSGSSAFLTCLLYTSPSPRDKRQSRMPSSA